MWGVGTTRTILKAEVGDHRPTNRSPIYGFQKRKLRTKYNKQYIYINPYQALLQASLQCVFL